MAFGFDKFRQARPSAYNNIIYKNKIVLKDKEICYFL